MKLMREFNKILTFFIVMLVWLLVAFCLLWPLFVLCILTYPIFYLFTKKTFREWYYKWEDKLTSLV